jgi:hypothetical protein
MAELLKIATPVRNWPAPHIRCETPIALSSLLTVGDDVFAVGGNILYKVDSCPGSDIAFNSVFK